MIDIHTHVLPMVDDGSDNMETSLNMLKESARQGITDVVLTPHYRGRYVATAEQLKTAFDDFKTEVSKHQIPVNLYLGQEISINKDVKDMLKAGELLTMNGTKFALIEIDYDGSTEVAEEVYELKRQGFIPIIAHVERFPYVSLQDVVEIKSLGGYIQVNASSIVRKDSRTDRKKVKKLFKYGLVDFVASDIHSNRVNVMQDAFEIVKKKYGEDTANAVFNENAKKIIEG